MSRSKMCDLDGCEINIDQAIGLRDSGLNRNLKHRNML